MNMQMSAAARAKLTEPWEERVNYVYDDKRGKVRVNGKLQYAEWDGGPVRGTLTLGLGHTDAAGAPKIEQGMRITNAECDAIFAADIAPCERAVNRLLKVKVTQHQFDALVDTYFNCPSAVDAIKLINAGNARAVPSKLLQYTYSKGEHMDGLTNRRMAEIHWFNTADHFDGPEPPNPDTIECPKGERNPQPKPTLTSKAVNAGGAIVAGGGGTVIATIQKANDAAGPIKEARDNLTDLGILDWLSSVAHSPIFAGIAFGVMAALAAFLVFDRWMKLRNDHV
jgi:GH24 family phage-related lysozyme (muramidase)